MVFTLHSLAQRVAAAALFYGAVGEASKPVNDSDCNCYLTNGSAPTYFTSHSFLDFRDLGKYAGVPKLLRNDSRSSKAAVTSDYFHSDEWAGAWSIQDWDNSDGKAPVLRVNSRNNVYIQENKDTDASSDTYLTLRTTRLPGFQSTAEIESKTTYQYLSARMMARVTGSPGACLAMFTYYAPSGELADVQEADIEILTREPRDRIQYTNQPSYTDEGAGGGDGGDGDNPKATRNVSLSGGRRWDQWLEHRLDWTPEGSVWYVTGEEVARIEFQTPRDPAQLLLNAWSDGGVWTGNMSVGGEAYLQLQWLEMVYNATDGDGEGKGEGRERRTLDGGPHGRLAPRGGKKKDDGGCKVVCSIDERDSRDAGSSSRLGAATDDNDDKADSMAPRLWAENGMATLLAWALGAVALLCFT